MLQCYDAAAGSAAAAEDAAAAAGFAIIASPHRIKKPTKPFCLWIARCNVPTVGTNILMDEQNSYRTHGRQRVESDAARGRVLSGLRRL